jgi:hypothetical protein
MAALQSLEQVLLLLLSTSLLMRARTQSFNLLLMFLLLAEEAQNTSLSLQLLFQLQSQGGAASDIVGLALQAFQFVKRPWELPRERESGSESWKSGRSPGVASNGAKS